MGIDPRTLRGSLATRVFEQLRHDSMTKRPSVAPQTQQKIVRSFPAATGKKRNASNDGRRFQEVVERTAAAYEALGVLRMRKVDPPVKIVGKRILFMENPWPDFVGCLHDRRMIALEAKSTSEHRLGFDGDARLTRKQVTLLIDWGKAGAVSGVLWEFVGNGVCWVPWPELEQARRGGAKSLLFGDWQALYPVDAGAGGVEWDFASHFTQQPPAC